MKRYLLKATSLGILALMITALIACQGKESAGNKEIKTESQSSSIIEEASSSEK